MSVFDTFVQRGLPLIPKPLLWLVARRYVAGERLDDAIARLSALRERGFGGILDLLGEGESTPESAAAVAAAYVDAVARLPAGCEVSVKPTHLGLLIDEATCEGHLERICAAAAGHDLPVRLEMEDAPTIDGTLAVFERVRARHERLGCVLQARLFRTRGDAERLTARFEALDVRLVKGVYLEPAAIAWTDADDIRRSYLELGRELLARGASVALATHDDAVAEAMTAAWVEAGGAIGSPRCRFQVLLGVREAFAERLRAQGHDVAVYVPYGPDWRPYSLRRLASNPEIARHVLRALVFGDR